MSAVSAWGAHAVPAFAGQHDTHIDTGEDYATITLADIFGMEPGALPKGKGLAFIPSAWNAYNARCHAVQREHGTFVALTADIDRGDHPLAVIGTAVRQFVGDAARLIYSSPHARHGDMRWRVIVPLAEPAPFLLWQDAQTAFFHFLEAQGIVVDRSFNRAAQPVYLPNVPYTHAKSGEALRGADGQPLYYQRFRTRDGAPGLSTKTGITAELMAVVQARRNAEEQRRQAVRTATLRKRASRPAGNCGSLIEWFNSSNEVADLLTYYGYEQSPRTDDDWRSPHQSSDSYATRIIEGKWVSLSASDAASGLGARSRTGCYGDAFDLFVHFEHGGNRIAALRQLGQENRAAAAPEASARLGGVR